MSHAGRKMRAIHRAIVAATPFAAGPVFLSEKWVSAQPEFAQAEARGCLENPSEEDQLRIFAHRRVPNAAAFYAPYDGRTVIAVPFFTLV